MSGSNIRCIFCRKYLVAGTNPRQASCGDRLCGACFSQREKESPEVPCPVCHEKIYLANSFRDKAVEFEAANATVQCSNSECPWEGLATNIEAHDRECKYGIIHCPHPRCSATLPRGQLKLHREQCYYRQAPCHLCGITMARGDIKDHIEQECLAAEVECRNKCGKIVTRGRMDEHTMNECTLQMFACSISSCTFKGTPKQLQEHESMSLPFHLRCINNTVQELKKSSELLSRSIPSKAQSDKLATEREKALGQAVADITSKLKVLGDNITKKIEPAVFQLQEATNEMGLTLQTLQATTYDGKFVWKIPEVIRRRQEARNGKTVSLYSAPFYTSRHGYKVCLRLYMNGDGTGKGTHLSFFITLMRGEYDALLPWPFKQAVTLTLVDQNKQRDIVQSFRPEPTSSSFQRPRNEMNIASGCPTFALVSVLDNSSYVKDDTIFLKCKIDLVGLEGYY